MRQLRHSAVAVALGAALTVPLTGCGGNDLGGGVEAPAVTPSPVAEIDDLEGVSTAVTLDPSLAEALTGLLLVPGVVGAAQFDPQAGRVTFPITGGDVTYYDPESEADPFLQGEIRHEGAGLSLTALTGTTVRLTDFTIDPEEGVLTGTVSAGDDVVAESVPLFSYDLTDFEPLRVDEAAGTAVLEGATLSLTAEAVQLLNDTFGTDALTEGLAVGTTEITLQLPQG